LFRYDFFLNLFEYLDKHCNILNNVATRQACELHYCECKKLFLEYSCHIYKNILSTWQKNPFASMEHFNHINNIILIFYNNNNNNNNNK
jgi:hypothetical protein